ncbi:MAG TPA: hypothetical protein DCY79_23710 [Planctomycetaceae bacterium]|nr:hypothetical protein [Blastopirellula sp.]HAY82827.1 hypothetical protein [Planctomycetaceae bacterium]
MAVVLFDLDDTLFDHQFCSRAGLAAVQATFPGRLPGTVEAVEARYRVLLEEWHLKVLAGLVTSEASRVERFREMLSDEQHTATDEESQHAATCYREAFDQAYRPVPGALALLQRIRGECPIGIVTNHLVAEQVEKIAKIGVEPYVDALVVSEAVGEPKPAAPIFEVALARLGGTAEQAVMIGDSWASDIVGAAGMGIRAIWLNRYESPCPDPAMATEIRALEPVDAVAELILRSS